MKLINCASFQPSQCNFVLMSKIKQTPHSKQSQKQTLLFSLQKLRHCYRIHQGGKNSSVEITEKEHT